MDRGRWNGYNLKRTSVAGALCQAISTTRSRWIVKIIFQNSRTGIVLSFLSTRILTKTNIIIIQGSYISSLSAVKTAVTSDYSIPHGATVTYHNIYNDIIWTFGVITIRMSVYPVTAWHRWTRFLLQSMYITPTFTKNFTVVLICKRASPRSYQWLSSDSCSILTELFRYVYVTRYNIPSNF